MTLLDQPPYMAADARPPATRQCHRRDGAPKARYGSERRAKRVIRLLRRWSCVAYQCELGHHHVGHRLVRR